MASSDYGLRPNPTYGLRNNLSENQPAGKKTMTGLSLIDEDDKATVGRIRCGAP